MKKIVCWMDSDINDFMSWIKPS